MGTAHSAHSGGREGGRGSGIPPVLPGGGTTSVGTITGTSGSTRNTGGNATPLPSNEHGAVANGRGSSNISSIGYSTAAEQQGEGLGGSGSGGDGSGSVDGSAAADARGGRRRGAQHSALRIGRRAHARRGGGGRGVGEGGGGGGRASAAPAPAAAPASAPAPAAAPAASLSPASISRVAVSRNAPVTATAPAAAGVRSAAGGTAAGAVGNATGTSASSSSASDPALSASAPAASQGPQTTMHRTQTVSSAAIIRKHTVRLVPIGPAPTLSHGRTQCPDMQGPSKQPPPPPDGGTPGRCIAPVTTMTAAAEGADGTAATPAAGSSAAISAHESATSADVPVAPPSPETLETVDSEAAPAVTRDEGERGVDSRADGQIASAVPTSVGGSTTSGNSDGSEMPTSDPRAMRYALEFTADCARPCRATVHIMGYEKDRHRRDRPPRLKSKLTLREPSAAVDVPAAVDHHFVWPPHTQNHQLQRQQQQQQQRQQQQESSNSGAATATLHLPTDAQPQAQPQLHWTLGLDFSAFAVSDLTSTRTNQTQIYPLVIRLQTLPTTTIKTGARVLRNDMASSSVPAAADRASTDTSTEATAATRRAAIPNTTTAVSSASTPAQASSASTPAQASSASTPTQASSASTPAQASSTSTPVQASSASTPMQASSASTPTQASSASTPAQASSASTPAQAMSAAATETNAKATDAAAEKGAGSAAAVLAGLDEGSGRGIITGSVDAGHNGTDACGSPGQLGPASDQPRDGSGCGDEGSREGEGAACNSTTNASATAAEGARRDRETERAAEHLSLLQAHTTFATLVVRGDGLFGVSVVKQVLWVAGCSYILHEIYGINDTPPSPADTAHATHTSTITASGSDAGSAGGEGSGDAAGQLQAQEQKRTWWQAVSGSGGVGGAVVGSGAGVGGADSGGGASNPAGAESASYSGLNSTLNSECVVCLGDARDTLVLPCRHLCLCLECAVELRSRSNKCPICRCAVNSLLQIKLSGRPRGAT